MKVLFNSMIFDNSKIKRLAPDFACTTPFSWDAQEIVAWYAADPARQQVDEGLNVVIDEIITAYEASFPSD